MFRPFSFFAVSALCGLSALPAFSQFDNTGIKQADNSGVVGFSTPQSDGLHAPWPETTLEKQQAQIRTLPIPKEEPARGKGMTSVQELRNPLSDEDARRLDAANRELNSGNVAKGLEQLNRATEKPSTAGHAHALLGTHCLKKSDIPCALTHLREAVRILPGLGAARSNYGYALLAAGAIADAERELRRALTLTPSDPYPNFLLGVLLLSSPDRRAEAARRLQAAESKFERARLARAVLFALEKDAAAVKQEIAAVSADPDRQKHWMKWVSATAAKKQFTSDLLAKELWD